MSLSPARVYDWTDPGAPPLTSATPGSVLRVLRACLVDGYGSRQPAGWSMPYTDGLNPPRRAMFRQAERTGWPQMFVEVDDRATTGADLPCRFIGWETASGLDAGDGRFPPGATVVALFKASGFSAEYRWTVVATNRWFWMATHAPDTFGNPGEHSMFYYGDTIPLLLSDTYAVIIAGSWTEVETLPAPGSLLRGFSRPGWTPRNHVGESGAVQLTAVDPHSQLTRSGTYVGQGALGVPNLDGKEYIARLMFRQGNTLRLLLPLWWPLHNWVATGSVTHFSRFSGSGALAGREFVRIRFNHYAFAIEISNTWGTL